MCKSFRIENSNCNCGHLEPKSIDLNSTCHTSPFFPFDLPSDNWLSGWDLHSQLVFANISPVNQYLKSGWRLIKLCNNSRKSFQIILRKLNKDKYSNHVKPLLNEVVSFIKEKILLYFCLNPWALIFSLARILCALHVEFLGVI